MLAKYDILDGDRAPKSCRESLLIAVIFCQRKIRNERRRTEYENNPEALQLKENEIIKWQEIFFPSVPVLELILRGSLVYLAIFALLRFVLKRVAGTLSIGDLLIIVLVADAAQNAMSAGYTSVTDGLILVVTIIFWSYALDWLAYHFPGFERFVHPPPLPLVRDGQMIARNMRRELITVDELMSHLREQGVAELKEVKTASMEGDGRISVVTHEKKTTRPPEKQVT